MLTYLNNPDLKTRFLAEIAKHEAADAIIKGTYGAMNGEFRGCAIGCSLHSLNLLEGKTGKDAMEDTDNHHRYEAELGLPMWLACLEDFLFEELPDDLAKRWPRRLAAAIPVGAIVDDAVLAKILVWSLVDAEFGVRQATNRDDVRGWIDVIATYITADVESQATDDLRESAARDAWAARAAWDVWDAWDAEKANAFYPALSEYVLALMRDLPVQEPAGVG